MADKVYLGDKAIYELCYGKNGNDNALIVGATGSGKTKSVCLPTAIHLNEASAVITVSKRADADMLIRSFKHKGYKVIDMNFAVPKETDYVFDPLDFIRTDEDTMDLANALVMAGVSDMTVDSDTKYWNSSAENVIASFISLLKMTDIPTEVLLPFCDDKQPTFADIIRLNRALTFTDSANGRAVVCPLDELYNKIEKMFGNCMAVQNFKTVKGVSVRTASCIASVVNEALTSFLSPTVVKMLSEGEKRHIDFKMLGKERTALIITTSPLGKAMNRYITVLYYMLLKELLGEAEKNGGKLDVPIMCFMDDFGNNKVANLDEYMSIFREAGISVTMFVQSLTQLDTMYEKAAETIKDNCGTMTFFSGNQNIETCKEISVRTDKPLSKVLSSPKGKVIICRAGKATVITDRYNIFEDKEYQKLVTEIAEERQIQMDFLDDLPFSDHI